MGGTDLTIDLAFTQTGSFEYTRKVLVDLEER